MTFEWCNEESKTLLERKYLDNETVEQACKRIAKYATIILKSSILNKKNFDPTIEDRIYECLEKGWFAPASPTWSNFGTGKGFSISCFSSYVPDSMGGILDTAKEIGMLSKMGGGTGAYFGDLRPRGSKISKGGESDGPVSFMQIFDAISRVVSQGGTRKGSTAVYLPIDHKDIEEFLLIRTKGNPVQDLHFGVCVPDYWIKQMREGDIEKRKIWAKVLKARKEVGEPYFFFNDNVNKNKPQVYFDNNFNITHSNLCVTGDQRVPTQFGILTAKELHELEEELILFDNEKLVNASSMKLIEKNADVYKITLDNGMSHTITSYHKVKTKNGIKTCSELNIDDFIAIQTNKGLFGNKDMKQEAFLLGLYQSDGTQHKKNIMLDIWENDFDLIEEIQNSFNDIHYRYGADSYKIISKGKEITRGRKPATFHDCIIPNGNALKKRLTSRTLKKCLNFEKGYIPDWIWESNEETIWQYIRGMLYADGTVFMSKANGNPIQISYSDINYEFLQELQILFANLGLQSSIRLLREEGKNLLPNGKGGQKYYNTKTCYRLIVGNKKDALEIEKNTGFLSRKNIFLENRDYRDNTKKFYKIVSIEHVGQEDVYCCKVDSEEKLWICNGVITHNCTEITLSTSIDESFVCCLNALNLEKRDEWINTHAVETSIYLQDALMESFIRDSEGVEGFERARKFAMSQRALGLGTTGFHSYLQSKMISFESEEAEKLNIEIYSNLQAKAIEASIKMAKDYGKAPLLAEDKYLTRHTTLIAIAPNTSSSSIMGQCSPGIEPFHDNYFTVDLAGGIFIRKNKYLKKILQERGYDNAIIWKKIQNDLGSVKNIQCLTDDEKEVFKTFFEIGMMKVVKLAADRQKYIDQGQSLNLYFDPNEKPSIINKAVLYAHELGIKTLYYQINKRPKVEKKEECDACAG